MLKFLSSINVYQYADFRREAIRRCDVTASAWSQWANGGTVSAKYKKILDEVALEMFGRPVFEGKGAEA